MRDEQSKFPLFPTPDPEEAGARIDKISQSSHQHGLAGQRANMLPLSFPAAAHSYIVVVLRSTRGANLTQGTRLRELSLTTKLQSTGLVANRDCQGSPKATHKIHSTQLGAHPAHPVPSQRPGIVLPCLNCTCTTEKQVPGIPFTDPIIHTW